MIEFLKSWAINITTLAILIVLLEILVPSGKARKFVSLITGFILLIAIINPLLGLYGKGIDLKELQIPSSNFIDKKEIEESSSLLKQKQMEQISEMYRQKVISQLEESAKSVKGVADAKADVIINDDYNSDTFGELKKVYLTLTLGDNSSDIKPVEAVQKVEIKNDGSSEKPKKAISSEVRGEIEDKVVSLFGVSKDNIVLSTS